MNEPSSINRRDAATLRAWLLAMLRFAVTLDSGDRIVALAAAAELDRPRAAAAHAPAFRYFHRTSVALCAAIHDPVATAGAAVLQRHLAQITDVRLQRAFAAALDITCSEQKPALKRPAGRINL